MRRIGLDLQGVQIEQIIDYTSMLVRANSRFNLLSRRTMSPAALLERHIKDSLKASKHLLGNEIADVGSGAGLPGVPLAIANTHCRVTLIERAARRCDFLRLVKTRLGLENLNVLEADAKELGHQSHEEARFDTALARALAKPEAALRILVKLVRASGRVVLFVGEQQLDVPDTSDGRSVRMLRATHVAQIPLGTRP